MKHDAGFTLIEVIFVLAVLSVLIVISAPIKFSVLEKKTEETFLKTLEMDLLYMQSLSSNSKKKCKLHFENPGYYTIQQNELILRERQIPESWYINKRKIEPIIFNESGRIIKPGTFAIHTLKEQYNVVCPLGKARCYIAKQ